MGTATEILLSVERMGSYEEYITGLIYFRNELDGLISSWPRARGGAPLPVSSCSPQQTGRFLARLSALITGYEYTMHRYLQSGVESIDAVDIQAEPRPAGLPAMPEADRLERDLLSQVEQLLADLSSLRAEVSSHGQGQKVPPPNRMQWLVSYLADWQ